MEFPAPESRPTEIVRHPQPGAQPSGFEGGSLTFPDLLVRPSVVETFPLSVPHPRSLNSAHDLRIAAAPFAQKNLSILLDTHAFGEQDDAEVPQFGARLPLRSPNAVSLKAKLRIER
jgi:hypothetical protein